MTVPNDPQQQPQPPQQPVVIVRQALPNSGANAAGITITVLVVVFVGLPLLACGFFVAIGLLNAKP